jgi:NAD+ kinase
MSNPAFKHVFLIGRHEQNIVKETLSQLHSFLTRLNIAVSVEEKTADFIKNATLANAENLPKTVDLIIVVGGDGSLLHAAQTAQQYDIPIIGVYRGHLGFLTDLPPDNTDALQRILQGEYMEQPRHLLNSTFTDTNGETHQELALNDAVLLPGDAIHMMTFDTRINQQLVYEHRANGLIVATPTGSTAYSLSAGGPILHPTLDAIILVPMYPHTLASRPLVIKNDSHIEIEIKNENNFPPYLTCDGRTKTALKLGSILSIKTHPKPLKLIHPTDYHFYNRLHEKLGWERHNDRT